MMVRGGLLPLAASAVPAPQPSLAWQFLIPGDNAVTPPCMSATLYYAAVPAYNNSPAVMSIAMVMCNCLSKNPAKTFTNN